MPKTITFINEKGGIGKTSLCFNIAWEMSKKKRILLLDMDGQKANLSYFCGVNKETLNKTIYDIFYGGKSAEECIVSIKDKLDIIPASSVVSNLNESAKPKTLKAALNEVSDKYDYIFVDVNPTPNRSHTISLMISDFVIIPMLPDVTSLEANKGIIESLDEIWDMDPNRLKVLGLVFNQFDGRTNLSKDIVEIADKYAERLETIVFKSRIRRSVKLSENVKKHIGITDYDKKCDAAQDVISLTKEIEKEVKKHGR